MRPIPPPVDAPQPDRVAGANREVLASLGIISAAVAHEFRNSLGAMANIFALLRRDASVQGDIPKLLDIAQEELERMNALITSLLDFAKPKPPELQSTNIPHLLERVAAAARALAVLQDIVVEVQVEPELPEFSLDPFLLHQALLNLAKNAVEAMPSGGTLHIGAGLREGSLHLWVDDEGTGVSDEVEQKMFEPFFTTKSSGIGLGLPLVRRIAEQHGGKVQVERRSPRGTRVALQIVQRPTGAER